MAASSSGEKHVTFLLGNIPAEVTVTDDYLATLINETVEQTFRFQEKVLMRAKFSEEGTLVY